MSSTLSKMIGPAPRSTPSEPRRARRELPEDILRQASRRLAVVALLGAVLWLVVSILGLIVTPAATDAHHTTIYLDMPLAIAAASFVASLALYFYARRSRGNPRTILDLGLAYQVLIAVGLGQMFHWAPMEGPPTPMISWVGVILLIFAAVVPSTPKKTLLAGLLSVSMMPLGMFIAKARGHWDFGPWYNALLMHYPDFILAGVATVISHVVTRLGQQVTRARELGSYQLGELLGKGGMGEVYRATHRMLARPAAIKLIKPETLAEGSGEGVHMAIARFRREAEVAAALRSPHTVELYDFGVTDDQTLYLVMELLDGMDLEELVREAGPLPPARVVHIVAQVCDSLAEAHALGMVHRDIKPANIHVGQRALSHDFVKVLDFGLVKTAGAAGELSLQTAAGHTPGTPAYLAPEIALGRPIDGRADLYALGCVAYYALTGRLVFEGKTGFEVISKHLTEAPPAPSASAAGVPPALDDLVLSCLAKDPDGRPASARALAAALEGLELEPWGSERAKEWWTRRKKPGGIC